jgi:hypothetical protein
MRLMLEVGDSIGRIKLFLAVTQPMNNAESTSYEDLLFQL